MTHANALDTDFSLRIAPELYLKRLVVGGYERVFEIARNFRNEGIDTRHSPEFTSLEAYRAFGDFNDGMDLTEHLIVEAARGAAGRLDFDVGGQRVDLTPPWPRRDLLDLLEERLGQRVHPSMPVADLRSVCEAHDVAYLPQWGSGKLIFELYDKILMPRPWVRCSSTTTRPRSRRWPARPCDDPTVTDRFELVIDGRELANGYSELNDPDEQARAVPGRGRGGRRRRPRGPSRPTCAFVRALEYGLPPTSGIGIGIDRLIMLLRRGPGHPRRHPVPDHAAGGVNLLLPTTATP